MSQIYHPGVTPSIEAATDVVASRFLSVTGGYSGADGHAIGVSLYDTGAGRMVAYIASGVAVVEAGAAVTAGVRVGSDATGRAITSAATGGAITDSALGTALETAAAAGKFIRVKLSL